MGQPNAMYVVCANAAHHVTRVKGLKRRVVRWTVSPIKSPPMTSEHMSVQILLCLPPFGHNINTKLRPTPILSPFRVRVSLESIKWYISKCRPHIPILLTSIMNTKALSCTVWPQYMTQQTTDRVVGIGRPCSSIDILKGLFKLFGKYLSC